MQASTSGRYQHRTVADDLYEVKEYTLKNGLKLLMSVNSNEPRVHTNIAFRAGSKLDPAETTGLAHYMEHMLFKGGSRIGALDWERERELLDRIAALYEEHRQTGDAGRRQSLYREIDRLSVEAARLVAPNEYDRLAASLGASGTNAYTWVEQTVYVNEIPANELGRWMELEAERFRVLALRLFHTELETVYEEFNISQDHDFRKVNNSLRAALFPRHPYGTQTTLGTAEHLRNPSMNNIQHFFQTYYVPNNMAIVLAGDFDPDEVVRLAEAHFGHLEPRPLPPFDFEAQPPLEGPLRREVLGREAPYLQMGWRLEGAASNAPLMATLLLQVLHNERAGLLDLHLNQEQRVLESEAWMWSYEDFTTFGLYGKAREGQSLEAVEALLLAELDKVRRGDFDDWLMEAVINDLKLSHLESSEHNASRVSALTNMFVLGVDWERFVRRIDWMAGINKEELSRWAREHLRDDNYAVVYKRQEEPVDVVKVDKPPITAVELNRGALSEYAKTFLAHTAPPLEPQFADFEAAISRAPLADGLAFEYVHNPDNGLFRLDYIFEMGKTSDRTLPIALIYLDYLGTGRYTPAGIKQEFFRLGINFDVRHGDERSYISLEGLDENLEAGIRLLEHLLEDVQPHETALRNVVSDIRTKRGHAKTDRNFILRNALTNYGKYGAHSPFRYRLSEAELQELNPADLTRRIRELNSYEHEVYYYGPRPIDRVAALLDLHHRRPERRHRVPTGEVFEQIPTDRNRLLLLDFPIVQTDVMLLSKGTPHFNLEEFIMRELYNNYFGYGLSSIVFQEIRESRALAYSTYAYYGSPRRRHRAHYLQAYVGTQPDKLPDAVPALLGIIEEMPIVDDQIEQARQSILRQIETDRLPPKRLYWAARSFRDLGYNRDLRRDIYQRFARDGRDGLLDFHRQYVKGRPFTFLLLGDKSRIDRAFLDSFGDVEEVTMEEVFGY